MKKLLLVLSITFLSGVANAAPRMDLSFFIGPSVSQSGDIQDLGDPNMNTAFEFNFFLNDNHGLGLSIGNEFDFEGSSEFPTIRDASIHTFDIHYALRYRPQNSKIRFSFTPGIGFQTIYDESNDYYWGYYYYEDISSAWVLNYKLMADYILKEWDTDASGSNLFVGFGINQIFSFNDEYAGRDISGSRLSALFRVGFGF